MSKTVIEEVKEQLNNENNGYKTLIIRVSDMSFWVFDKIERELYYFEFIGTAIEEQSTNIYMGMADYRTGEYAEFSVPLTEFSKTRTGSGTIAFAEEYIDKFKNEDNKMIIK